MAKKDYSQYEKKELIEKIEQLEEGKKYGLVWEDKPEKVVKQCQTELPVLEEVKNKEIITDKDKSTNILIEGDNYHALSVLNYTHAGKIDVIYIDPPYNTGNQDFIFNDRYVDKEDQYRHSKWLSFMNNRLNLCKNLLSNNGVMFIHIDEHEIAQLTLLCSKLFDEHNIDVLIWEKTANITNTKIIRRIKPTHEYVAICYKNKQSTYFGRIKKKTKWNKEYTNPDNDPRGPFLPGIISLEEKRSNPKSKNFYGLKLPSGRIITREWYYSKSKLDELIRDNRIYFPKAGDGVPRIKIFQNEEQSYYCNSILTDLGTNTSAKEEIKELFDGKDIFDTPKPTKLGMELIRLIKDDKITILDFFAGTGTAGQAVLELNQEDGGNRKFILCTNNEDNNGTGLKIATDICYPRIKKVIEGYGDKKPLKGNLRYFKTDFVPTTNVSDDTKYSLVNRSTEMICLREDTFDKVLDKKYIKVFENKDQYTAILFHLEDFNEFKKEVKKLDKPIHIYIFSLTNDTYEDDFKDIKQKFDLCPIPESILEVYRKIFRD